WLRAAAQAYRDDHEEYFAPKFGLLLTTTIIIATPIASMRYQASKAANLDERARQTANRNSLDDVQVEPNDTGLTAGSFEIAPKSALRQVGVVDDRSNDGTPPQPATALTKTNMSFFWVYALDSAIRDSASEVKEKE